MDARVQGSVELAETLDHDGGALGDDADAPVDGAGHSGEIPEGGVVRAGGGDAGGRDGKVERTREGGRGRRREDGLDDCGTRACVGRKEAKERRSRRDLAHFLRREPR